jgi:hypothetical protein
VSRLPGGGGIYFAGQAKLLPVYLELTDAATFRVSYNERISTTFNNEAVLRTILYKTPNETRIHFFQKINYKKKKKKITVVSAI